MDSEKQEAENEAGQDMELYGLFRNSFLLSMVFLLLSTIYIEGWGFYFIIPIFLLPCSVQLYFLEAFGSFSASTTRAYSWNTMDAVSASTLVESLVDSRPAVIFFRGGESKDFAFNSWRDTSKVFPLEQGAHRVGLRLKKSFTCEDKYTEQRFSRAFEKYKKNSNKNSDYDPEHKMELDGFVTVVKDILVMDPEKPRPLAVGPWWYTLFTLLGLSWPYRMYIKSLVNRNVEHHITKVIQVDQPKSIEQGQGHGPNAAGSGGTES